MYRANSILFWSKVVSLEQNSKIEAELEKFFNLPYTQLVNVDLVKEGLIDSMKVVELILLIEEYVGNEIDPEIIDRINWRDIEEIAKILYKAT